MFERPARLEFSATSKRTDLAISFVFTETGSGTLVHGEFDPNQNFRTLCKAQAQSPST